MEKITCKKLFVGILALSAGFVLAGCDPIKAVPSNYDNAILKDSTGEIAIDDNIIGNIYDLVTTDKNKDIADKILKEIAINKFGSYKEINEASASDAKKIEFANNHKDVFVKNEDDSDALKIHRFDEFKKDIDDRISETFYKEIVSGTYNDADGMFDEEKLFFAHYHEFYDITLPKKDGEYQGAKFFVNSEFTKEKVFSKAEEDKQYCLKGTYSNSEKRGYIEEKVLPEILKDKLVEEYIYSNNYSSLGRSYARKVSYIKVSYEDHVIPWTLLKAFGDTYVASAAEMDFELIAKVLKGFDSIDANGVVTGLSGGAATLAATAYAGYDKVTAAANPYANGTFYKDSEIGKIIDSYNKACEAEDKGRFPTDEQSAALTEFTSGGKSKEYNLRKKIVDIAKKDYTTEEEWYVKNGGLTDLPSALRDRLFNIGTANCFDDNSLVKENSPETMGLYEYEGGVKANGKVKRMPYMRDIYGKKLLIPAKCQDYADNNYNYIYQDTSGKAFYIVQVLEAPSNYKLNVEKDAENTYAKLYPSDAYKTEDVAKAVAKALSTKETFIKDAYTEYLNKYSFMFYDTSLYEYFESEYPDLDMFDED